MKHTPGPWKLASSRENDGSFIIIEESEDSDHPRIGTASFRGIAKRGKGWETPDPEGEANAHLLAAAPDLLNACKSIMKFFANSLPKKKVAEGVAAEVFNAIAKAEKE